MRGSFGRALETLDFGRVSPSVSWQEASPTINQVKCVCAFDFFTTKIFLTSARAGLSACITSLTPMTHRTCAKVPPKKISCVAYPTAERDLRFHESIKKCVDFERHKVCGCYLVHFFMSFNFYRLDIHNKITRVALANL